MSIFKKPYTKYIIVILIALIIALIIILFARSEEKEPQDAQITLDETNIYDEPKKETDEYDWKKIKEHDDIKDYEYNFNLILNTDNMTMDGIMDFTYYNNNDIAMDELVFYLYANSHSEKEHYAIAKKHTSLGYPNGFSPGGIEIKSIDIQGGGTYEVTGSQNHLLVISLDEQVKTNKSTKIKIEYTVTIPNSHGRFGYGDETISIVNCNPIMAVYDKENGYYDYPYNSTGDPFFSECADYSANITVPKGYMVAPSGTITKKTENDKSITYIVDGENRRDFGFVASEKFSVLSKETNGVTVSSYSLSSNSINKKALSAAVASIEVFSSKFGEYPYETLNVVETNFFIGGMEYPGLVLIGDDFYTPLYDKIMEMIIVHEVAHQWWYAQVGNNQITEPWLDEALATFSERVYYEEVYPDDYEDLIFNYVDSSYFSQNKRIDKATTRIDLNTLEYGNEYSLVVYGFGGWMIEDLRQELGEEVFYEAMSAYLENNLFQIATRQDLEQAIEDITGVDITPWFEENLQVQVGY